MNNYITPRIVKCLTLRSEGMLSKQIADSMNISEKTVDEHFRQAKKVTGSKTMHQLTARFVLGEIATKPARVNKPSKDHK